MLVTVIPPTLFNFSYLGAAATETVRLAAAIDVSRFRSAQLIARTHTNDVASGTGQFTIKAYPSAPSPDDPRAFVSGTADGTITIDDGTAEAAPKYYNAAIATINGPYYTIELTATQGAGAAAMAAQISVDLVLREN